MKLTRRAAPATIGRQKGEKMYAADVRMKPGQYTLSGAPARRFHLSDVLPAVLLGMVMWLVAILLVLTS